MELNKIHEDISFIIQGLINPKITKKCLNNIRKYFPKSEIILSTYKGENIDGLNYDKVILTEDNFEKTYGMSAGMIKNIRLYMEESHARNK